MQFFLAYPNYHKSASILDPSRLGNQCYRETKTILSGKWVNHPISKMWKGHEYHICLYGMACALELFCRHKLKIYCAGKLYNHLNSKATGTHWFNYYAMEAKKYEDTGPPIWLGDPAFHASHRSNLLRKDPDWYSFFGWKEPNNLPYVWYY